jgi:hypothetical protein
LHLVAAISMWIYLIGSYLSAADLAGLAPLGQDAEQEGETEPAEPRPVPE